MDKLRSVLPLALLATLSLGVVFIWQGALASTTSDELLVVFLDVGQGDAIFIVSPTGRQALIDGGPDRSVLRELAAFMPLHDRSIDIIVATHPDADHIGGLTDVLERYEVDYILESGNISETAVYASFDTLAEEEGAVRILARRGMRIELGGGAALDILFPDRDVSGIESNSASIIAKLTYGGTSVMLTGDAPQAIEEHLATLDGRRLQSNILKAGHHGSRTSSAPSFVGFVAPEVVVISARCDNRYGHPHQEVLNTFAQFDIGVLSTCEEGSVVFISDGVTLRRR